MIDFKPIEDFTFDDCVKILDRHRAEGTSPDEELLTRYNSLLETLKAEEERDYPSVKTIDSLERYIKKYSNLTAATRYKPVFLSKAKQELADLRRRAKIKKKIKIIACIIFVLGIFASIFFIGYKPVSYFYVSDSSVSISKGAASDTIILRTNAPDIYIDEYISWLDVSKDGSSIIIKADRNTEDIRKDDFSIRAYPTFFGERIGFLGKTLTIYVEQQNGRASYLSLSPNRISFPPHGGVINVKIDTDGDDWNMEAPAGYFNIEKINDYLRIKAPINDCSSQITEYYNIFCDNIMDELIVEQSPFDYFQDNTVFYGYNSTSKETVTYYANGRCSCIGYVLYEGYWTKGTAEGRYYIDNNVLCLTWDDCPQIKCNLSKNQYVIDDLVYNLEVPAE